MSVELVEVPRSLRRRIERLVMTAGAHPWDGRFPTHARHRIVEASPHDPALHLSLILTLDHGTHASGWWRNSQYDLCFHLSICGLSADRSEYETPLEAEMRWWATAFFSIDVDKAWIEPPASALDRYRFARSSAHTWHVRLFLDRETGEAILPKGEVYTLKPWADGSSPEKVYR